MIRRWTYKKAVVANLAVIALFFLFTERGGRTYLSLDDFSRRGETMIVTRFGGMPLFGIKSSYYDTYLSQFFRAQGLAEKEPHQGKFILIGSWTPTYKGGESQIYRILTPGPYRGYWEEMIRNDPEKAKALFLEVRTLLQAGENRQACKRLYDEYFTHLNAERQNGENLPPLEMDNNE